MAYRDLKNLLRRTASDKVLCNKAFNITKKQKYDGYQRGFASVVYKVFDKRSSGANTSATRARPETIATQDKFADVAAKSEIMSNQELAEDSHKQIIRKFEKRKVHSSFIDNIWGADLPDIQLISKFNKVIHFLLCVIAIFSK